MVPPTYKYLCAIRAHFLQYCGNYAPYSEAGCWMPDATPTALYYNSKVSQKESDL